MSALWASHLGEPREHKRPMSYKRSRLADVEPTVHVNIPNNVPLPLEAISGTTEPQHEAYVLVRRREGWALVKLMLPGHVVEGYRISEDGPHNIDMIASKLSNWVEKRGYGPGK